MQNSRHLFYILFFVLSSSMVAQNHSQTIDSVMNYLHQQDMFNGNVLVIQKDKIIYQNELGWADAEGVKKLTENDLFNLGSISKEFTAVGIMLLKEQGKLELENDILGYLPQLPAWAGDIKIKHLLDYTSGLPKEEDDISGDEEAWEVLKSLSALEHEPGTAFLYSNFNIFLRKRIIEQVTGLSYKMFLKNAIFEPLEMGSAVVDARPGKGGHVLSFDKHLVTDPYRPFLSGQVSLAINDLFKWVKGLHSNKIISQESVDQLFRGVENQASALGVGIFEKDILKIHWHSGSSYNFQSSLAYFPEEEHYVLLMTNTKNMNLGNITTTIDAILREERFTMPKASLYLALRTEVFYNGYESGMELYDHIRQKKQNIYDLSDEEDEFLETAEYLVRKGKKQEALGLLKAYATSFPGKAKVSEAYEKLKKADPE